MWLRHASIGAALVLTLFFPALARAQDASLDIRTFVTLHVNTVDEGETLAILRAPDVLVSLDALEAAGIHGLAGKRQTINGKIYVSLASLAPAVTYRFDVDALALDVNAAPQHLAGSSVDLGARRPAHMTYTGGKSAYLNYALTDATGGAASAFFDGAFNRDQDSLHYSFTTERGTAFRRGLIYYQMDDRQTTVRRIIGDTAAQSGDLGGAVYLAGFAVARDFALDPYAITFPLPSLNGLAATPSVASIYVNGVLVQRVDLPPGSFDLSHLPVTTGRANTQVVVTDAFGRAQTYSQNYYTAASLLKPGLSDYQFAAGLLRTNAFATGDAYGPFAAIGRYRIGLTSALTLGGRVEVTPHLVSLGPVADVKIPLGYLHLAASASDDGGVRGTAASAGYTYTSPSFSANVSLLEQSPQYATLSQAPDVDRTTSALSATASWQSRTGSSFAVQYLRRHLRDSGVSDQLGVAESLPVARGFTLVLGAERDASTSSATSIGVTATLNFAVGRTSAALTSRTGSAQDSSIEIQQSPQSRYGFGYTATFDPSIGHAFNGSAIYRSTLGDAQLDLGTGSGRQPNGALRVDGSVAQIDGGLYLTRPVLGSFALVDVPDVPGVGVYAENEYVGKTDGRGTLIVPDLLPNYANAIRIDDKDIPLDTSIDALSHVIAPPAQAGSVVRFASQRLRAFDGRVLVRLRGASVEPTYGELTLDGSGTPRGDSALGQHGEFYFENLPAGAYRAHVVYAGGTCDFDLTIPNASAELTHLGTLTCAAP